MKYPYSWLTLALLVIVSMGVGPVQAKVNLVATVPDLGSVARFVGGPDVEVTVLCPGEMDPHFLPAKPSLARKLSRADMLIYNGLELEVGWLPQLISKARNPDIRPGSPGDVDCSQAFHRLLEIPGANVDRSEGDVHPLGNPHYNQDPRLMARVAVLLAERLARIDGDRADAYRQRAEEFGRRVEQKLPQWQSQTEAVRSMAVIIYHRSWSYLVDWLGLTVIGEIEHRPGIAPSPRHVQELVELGRRQDQLLIVAASWDHQHVAQEVADRTGGSLVVLPAQTGAVAAAKDYFELIDIICRELAEAADEEAK